MRKGLQVGAVLLVLCAAASAARGESWGLGSVAVGYEDNVVLVPDQLASKSQTGDNFLEGLGVGSLTVAQPGEARLALRGSAYMLDYRELNRFDLATLRAGPALQGVIGAWRWRLEASATRVYLDHDAFEQLKTVGAGLRHRPSPRVSWDLEYRRDWITGYRPYGYLTGTEDKVELSGRFAPSVWELEGGYELELNDRSDLVQGGDFASYSPTRHTLSAKVGAFPGAWDVVLEGEVRRSVYNDPHRQSGQRKTRRDIRWKLTARLAREVTGPVSAFAEATRTVNDSNLRQAPFTDYNYSTTYYLAGLQRLF